MDKIHFKENNLFSRFNLCLPLWAYWAHRLWSFISQKLLNIFLSGSKCLTAQTELYKVRSTFKKQVELPISSTCNSMDKSLWN